jgi:hypothetical protein
MGNHLGGVASTHWGSAIGGKFRGQKMGLTGTSHRGAPMWRHLLGPWQVSSLSSYDSKVSQWHSSDHFSLYRGEGDEICEDDNFCEVARWGFTNNFTLHKNIHEFGYCLGHLHLIEEVMPDIKAFIKPFILKRGDHLVGHTKAQQFPLLYAWQWHTSHTNWSFVHFTELGPEDDSNTCLAPKWTWQICVTRWRSQNLAHPTPWWMGWKSLRVYEDFIEY